MGKRGRVEDVTGSGATVDGDAMNVHGTGHLIRGDVQGNLHGTGTTVNGNVLGNVHGTGHIIKGNVNGSLHGTGHKVKGDVDGRVHGTYHQITGEIKEKEDKREEKKAKTSMMTTPFGSFVQYDGFGSMQSAAGGSIFNNFGSGESTLIGADYRMQTKRDGTCVFNDQLLTAQEVKEIRKMDGGTGDILSGMRVSCIKDFLAVREESKKKAIVVDPDFPKEPKDSWIFTYPDEEEDKNCKLCYDLAGLWTVTCSSKAGTVSHASKKLCFTHAAEYAAKKKEEAICPWCPGSLVVSLGREV